MRERCGTPSHHAFRWYGAKGVKVCEEWSTFEAFKDWALSAGYEHHPELSRGDRLSIDRINPDGDYEPSNCRWIPGRENSRRAATHAPAKEKAYLRLIA